ncbi:unnamed protein product [Penicillium salamii]|uniref:Uncharacterized protein n=1 Tax=Penicillium salamii TaxID=1612424 RepID=A0A9W4K2A5_9EURO|nr:unnamed protein product [Penicillium salamii]CAG7950491.1 unnamed protein product [Penicillium salamii]CAG8006901.1 unnamed protein product [Penicillium salamii]CAG8050297.1 unnamed protein product [Penicillium salamii]CAG8242317.1 unnamed protein product [Penicillium salamii]
MQIVFINKDGGKEGERGERIFYLLYRANKPCHLNRVCPADPNKYTTIPVPKVFCAFPSSGCTYLVMERIKGDIIGNGRVRRSEESKAKLLSRLAANIRQVRGLRKVLGLLLSMADHFLTAIFRALAFASAPLIPPKTAIDIYAWV